MTEKDAGGKDETCGTTIASRARHPPGRQSASLPGLDTRAGGAVRLETRNVNRE